MNYYIKEPQALWNIWYNEKITVILVFFILLFEILFSMCEFLYSTRYFYIQSFKLTECIVVARVRKTLGCLSAVRLSVCLSVCPGQYGETTGPISMKLSKIDPP